MQDLINARLERLRAIAQGQEPSPLPETEIETIFGELETDLVQELNEQQELEELWG